MEHKIELTKEPMQHVLSIRKRTSAKNLPKELGIIYPAIEKYLNEIGEQASGVPFLACYNMDMDDLDIEAGVPVSKELEGKDEIMMSSIPGGEQVSCMHKGSYKELVPVYDAMAKWMKERGCEPAGVVYEFYYNSPMEVAESELLTKIVFPLK